LGLTRGSVVHKLSVLTQALSRELMDSFCFFLAALGPVLMEPLLCLSCAEVKLCGGICWVLLPRPPSDYEVNSDCDCACCFRTRACYFA